MQSISTAVLPDRPEINVGIGVTAWQYVKACGISITIMMLVAVAAALPNAGVFLQFDRTTIEAGQYWRIITGHVVHWNVDHLFWDLTMFSLLAVFSEWRDRRQFVMVLLAAALAIPLSIYALQPHFVTYRGLSGLDSALFTLLAASLLQDKLREKQLPWVIGISLLLFGFGSKILFELITGSTVFVDSTAATFEPVPLAHIVGGLAGLLPFIRTRDARSST